MKAANLLRTAMHRQLPSPIVFASMGFLLFGFYARLGTLFGENWWPRGSCGGIFNEQAVALINGRMNLPPEALGSEAFVRDGLYYTYFGILPALLRIPLIPFLDRDWTALSCALAASIASLFLLLTLNKAAGEANRTWQMRILLLATAATFVASGPQFELTAKPTVYVEAILWGYVFACAFIWLAFPSLLGAALTPRRLAGLGTLAALALLTRVTTGLALYAACALLALVTLHQARANQTATVVRVLFPCALPLALGILAAGAVNYARWGNPTEFANLARNVFYSADEARSLRLRTYGAFEAERIPHAFKYYFAPASFFADKKAESGHGDIIRLFDKAEGPAASQFSNKLAWWMLGFLPLLRMWRGPATSIAKRSPVIAILAGFALAPTIIMSYGYLAFRFGAEFTPLAIITALLGVSAASAMASCQKSRLITGASMLLLGIVTFTQFSATWSRAADYMASDYTDGACD